MTRTVVDHPLLSHHGAAERHRCLTVPLGRGRYLVCARCAGAFGGLVVGLPVAWAEPALMPPWVLLLAFPDWIASVLLGHRGSNAVRVGSGLVIGLVYALNLRELVHLRFRADLWCMNVLAVAVYAVTVWLAVHRRRSNHVVHRESKRADTITRQG